MNLIIHIKLYISIIHDTTNMLTLERWGINIAFGKFSWL